MPTRKTVANPKAKNTVKAGATAVAEVRAATRAQWRAWLEEHHATTGTIWLVYPKRDTELPAGTVRLDYSAVVDEALCFGWIDSLPRRRDDGWTMVRVSPRKPGSGWSAVNKQKVAALADAGLMRPAGMDAVRAAQRDGSWSALDEAERMVVPEDLQRALEKDHTALRHFTAFPPRTRKNILQWIAQAKRPETRRQRITVTVAEAAHNRRANQTR